MARSLWFPCALVLIAGLWVATRFDLAPRPGPDHPHAPGTHGGLVVSLGDDVYHVEAVIESGGLLHLFTLGRDPTRVIDVEAQTLTAYVRADGASESREVVLNPRPQPGDGPGQTSRFTGRLPEDLAGRGVHATVPSLRIGRERFRVAFTTGPPMPEKVEGDEERELYLTPGGAYTAADIVANGNTTPSVTYRGFRANHDANPKPGDPVCPVTRTKADPRCTWTVAGERYSFCCPPCIDEFVQLAKTRPDRLRRPGDYVQPPNPGADEEQP
jgi:hypothetical protein